MDISLPISYKSFKFSTCIHEIWMQGSVSQNFDLGPSFDFMKCRNLNVTSQTAKSELLKVVKDR